jgi:hypothetical protein
MLSLKTSPACAKEGKDDYLKIMIISKNGGRLHNGSSNLFDSVKPYHSPSSVEPEVRIPKTKILLFFFYFLRDLMIFLLRVE